jgi:hypothetical protein
LVIATSPLLALHRELAEPQISHLLLQLALMVRTYDDLMANSRVADDYNAHAETTTGENYIGNLSDGNLDLREACNKIIHAAEIRPVYERIDREVVRQKAAGELDQNIWYLTGEIELNGTNRQKPWNATLHAESFIEIVLDRIAFGVKTT